MLMQDAMNFVGGMPDRLFSGVASCLRQTTPVSERDYRRSLEFYERYFNDAPSDEFFSLPKKGPVLNPSQVASFQDGFRESYFFPSGYRVKNPVVRREFESHARNSIAVFHLWRRNHSGERRPVVVCLHGFLMGNRHLAEKMFRIAKLFSLGVDVALFVLPHHGERTDFFLNQKLLNPQNIPLTLEGCAQIQYDLHSAILGLRKLGYDRIGLLGASLGGFAGITRAALRRDEEFLFTVVPAVRLQDYLLPDQRLFGFRVTPELKEQTARVLDLVTPANWRPKMDSNDIGAVIHAGDRLNPVASARAWVKAWNIANVVEVPGGHWMYFDRSSRGRAWYQWLTQKKFIQARVRKAES